MVTIVIAILYPLSVLTFSKFQQGKPCLDTTRPCFQSQRHIRQFTRLQYTSRPNQHPRTDFRSQQETLHLLLHPATQASSSSNTSNRRHHKQPKRTGRNSQTMTLIFSQTAHLTRPPPTRIHLQDRRVKPPIPISTFPLRASMTPMSPLS